MAGFGNAEINIFCIILLFILFLNMHRRSGEYLSDQKTFFVLLGAVAALLVLDSIQWVCDGLPGALAHNINQISSVFYYLLQPFPCMIWCIYVRYQITMDVRETLKGVKLLLIPFVLNAVMSVLSYFFKYYFYIDQNNFYHRSDLFWVFVVLSYCYFVYAAVYIIVNRARVEKKVFFSLMIFSLPPLLGSILQILHYGLSLSWPGCTLSLVIIYINIQKDQLYTDHLTGLYNRRLLDIHLDSCLKKNGESDGIGVIMMDIDDFKSINDTYGHVVGDQALVEMASVLKKSVEKEGFIARYGGDEFIVVVPAKDSSDIERVVNEIERKIRLQNERGSAQYKISLTMGYKKFKCGRGFSKFDVISMIDKQMYDAKVKY